MGKATRGSTTRKTPRSSGRSREEKPRPDGRGHGGGGGASVEEPGNIESGGGGEDATENQDDASVTVKRSPRDILKAMGLEFNALMEEDPTSAWKMRQRRLNEFMGDLSEVMSVKDIMEETRRIGEYLKQGSPGGGSGATSPLDEVREFLDDKVH